MTRLPPGVRMYKGAREYGPAWYVWRAEAGSRFAAEALLIAYLSRVESRENRGTASVVEIELAARLERLLDGGDFGLPPRPARRPSGADRQRRADFCARLAGCLDDDSLGSYIRERLRRIGEGEDPRTAFGLTYPSRGRPRDSEATYRRARMVEAFREGGRGFDCAVDLAAAAFNRSPHTIRNTVLADRKARRRKSE